MVKQRDLPYYIWHNRLAVVFLLKTGAGLIYNVIKCPHDDVVSVCLNHSTCDGYCLKSKSKNKVLLHREDFMSVFENTIIYSPDLELRLYI